MKRNSIIVLLMCLAWVGNSFALTDYVQITGGKDLATAVAGVEKDCKTRSDNMPTVEFDYKRHYEVDLLTITQNPTTKNYTIDAVCKGWITTDSD